MFVDLSQSTVRRGKKKKERKKKEKKKKKNHPRKFAGAGVVRGNRT